LELNEETAVFVTSRDRQGANLHPLDSLAREIQPRSLTVAAR
jgi:hypothetical protein